MGSVVDDPGWCVTTKVEVKAAGLCGDEEAFAWATASLGEARRGKKQRSAALLEAVVEELAFDLGAGGFPPAGARASRHRLGYDARMPLAF
jgi:hypothetical protein